MSMRRRSKNPQHDALRKALAPPPEPERTYVVGPIRDTLAKSPPNEIHICPCSSEDDIGYVKPVNVFRGVSYWRCSKCGHRFAVAPATTMPLPALHDEDAKAFLESLPAEREEEE